MTSNSLSYFARIEPLESRIAPALLVNGANLLGGAGNPDTGETSIAGNEATLVKVTSGQAIVWYNNGAVTGISFGPNTAIEILGNVGEYVSPSEYFFGSIVGNLTAEGRLSDSNNDPSDGEDGNVLLPNNLTSLKTFPLSGDNGDFGAIITGGAVSNVNVHGKVTVGIYAGDSVFREDSQVEGTSLFKSVSLGEVGPILDPNPLDLASTTGFTFSRAASTNLTAGASVSNVDVQTAENMQIFAGSGGLTASLSKGASGGNISNVTIHSAFSQVNLESYVLRAGDGQNGVAGGAGGSITGVIEETSSGKILIVSGQGGNGTGGPGGAGGSISLLDMQSDSSAYKVVTGNGGNGVGGGAGGAVVNTNFANNKATNSLIITRDFTKDGVDDVLVVDSNTGDLILSENTGDGANFTQVLQYMDGITPVYRIAGLGTTPVGAVAVDYDNDDDLDIVVAYKNSINLGVFTNTGEGGFWNFKTNAVNGFSVGLGFSPALLSLDKVGGTGLAVIGDDPGQSVLHHLISDGKTYIPHATGTKLGQFAVALTPVISTAGENLVYVATESGLLIPFAANSNPKEPAYTSLGAQFRLNSDILNLDVDTEGHRILVSQTGAKGISLFEVGPHGALAELAVPVLNPGGRPLLAKFVDDQTPMADSIAVLTALSAGSRIDLFDAREADEDPATEDAAFVLTNSLSTQPSLRNFGFAFDGSTFGVASVAGSLSQFFFSPSLSGLDSYVLPFTGKTVDMRTGDGGNAFDSGKVLGKGGSGGSISSFNADAIAIRLQAGDGGDSVNGAAGAGGSASNPSTFRSKSAQTITPRLVADESLIVLVGQGGTSSGEGVRAWGGDGGSINGMTLSLGAGEVVLSGGHGGASGRGGSLAGDGGNITGVKALSLGGDLLLKTGNGGDALPATNPVTKSNAKAGNGGTLSNFSFQLELTDMEEREIPYFVSITTGKGGSALGGTGGAGGTLSNASLKLDGPNRTYDQPHPEFPLFDSHADSTVTVSVKTGDGGQGKTGGAGGSVAGFSSASVMDQIVGGIVYLNYVVMDITSGKGGAGSEGAGGNGGNISFAPAGIAGVTYYDPDIKVLPAENPELIPLRITAGAGGGASTKGGLGGSITSLVAKNALVAENTVLTFNELAGARLIAGDGGAGTLLGAKGGDVSKITIGTYFDLFVQSGSGGAGGVAGVGGAGGLLGNSTFGSVTAGLHLESGHGGGGGKTGGTGGAITALQVNTPDISTISEVYEISRIIAGHGGDASAAAGRAGSGGSISRVFQSKDINSAINLIEAGNGGAAPTGVGGKGGSISSISTKGFIGSPTDGGVRLGIFDQIDEAQGLFVGRGGAGTVAGIAGTVSSVSARQIAAIAASIDASGNFAPASRVSGVTAEVIGYDINRNGALDTGDGFLWADALSGVVKTVKLKK